MTRTLRQRHRRTVTVIGVLLPVALVAGIAARRTVPVTVLPPGIGARIAVNPKVLWQRSDLFTKTTISIRLSRTADDASSHYVELVTPGDFVKPDLLVYWVAGNPAGIEDLPGDAQLLGGASAGNLRLPATAGNTAGVLVLYSLADREVVDVSKPITL